MTDRRLRAPLPSHRLIRPLVAGSVVFAVLLAVAALVLPVLQHHWLRAEILALPPAQAAEASSRLEFASVTLLLGAVVVLLLLGVGAIVLGLAARRAARGVTDPLLELTAVLQARHDGDRQVRADAELGTAEVREVASAINAMAEVGDRQRAHFRSELELAETLRRLASTVAGSLDLGEVLDRSVEPIVTGLGARAGWVRAFEGEGERPGRGRGARFPRQLTGIPTSEGMAAARRAAEAAWPSRAAVTIGADRTDPHVPAADHRLMIDFVGSLGATELLLAPVGDAGDCLGYLIMVRGPGQPSWGIAEAAAAATVGRDLGRAIVHARLYEREQQLVEQMRSLDARKNAFLSTVSHELRTPLAAILGHLELVRSGELGPIDPDAYASLTAVERNSQRLSRLIEDLLLVSQVEEGVQPTRLQPLDLRTIVAAVVDEQRGTAAQRGVVLTSRLALQAPVLGDTDELARVAANLISNAIKFSVGSGPVEVELDATADAVRLVVRDHGIGLSSTDREQLGTRFFRSPDPRVQAEPGTGLGLAVATLIIDKHRGRLVVESDLGRGSTFTVVLARHRPNRLNPDLPLVVRRSRSLRGALT